MKKVSFLAVLGIILFAITSQSDATIDPAKEKEVRSKIDVLQIPFIKNEYQIKNSRVKYYANTFAGTVFVTDDGITYLLRGKSMEHVGAPLAAPFVGANLRVRPEYRAENKDKEKVKGWVIKERLLNARKTKAVGIEKAETKVNYFKGKDQSNWKSNIPTYQEIGLGEVYDHIKLSLKAYGKNIEKLFIVEKGGRPEDIAIKVEGAKVLNVNEKGELEIETGIGTVKMTAPVAYQEIDGKKVQVAATYTIPHSTPPQADRIPHSTYCFRVKDYNRNYPLIIDPLLASTFIGGSDGDSAQAIAIDSSGNVFLTWYTSSADFPTTPGAYDTSYNGNYDAFVSKLNNTLTSLLASTYIGGNDSDEAQALAIDSAGNVFVAGPTSSSNFPTTPGAYEISYNGGYGDVFVSKLNNTLTSLLASTYIGGNGDEEAQAFTIDSSGNIFVAGSTASTNFPTTPGAYDTSYNGNGDAFVSKLNNTLTSLLASTYIGGGNDELAYALAIDSAGNVFVAGVTYSSNYPTTSGAYDTSNNGANDAFVSKLNNTLTSLLASTYIGGSDADDAGALSIDSAGNIFIAGWTFSSNYPTTSGAYDTFYNGGNIDGFVSKFNNTLSFLLASTYIGGSSDDYVMALAISSFGNVYVAGRLYSSDFPTTPGAYDTSYHGNGDAFVSKFNNTLTSLSASTFIGGSDYEKALALAIDSAGNVFVAGPTSSSNFPTTSGSYDTSYNGSSDVFLSKLDNNLSGGSSCTHSISPTSESFPASGGTGSVNITASLSSCSWTATSNSSWITITSGDGGTGNGTVNYSVSSNTSSSQRTGSMTIAGQTCTVVQDGTQTSECSEWADVIGKYQTYVNGQATWSDVIIYYSQYAS